MDDAGVREWIQEGRANAQTMLQREGQTNWAPLSSFPEFAPLLGGAPGQLPVQSAGQPVPVYHGRPPQEMVSGPATFMMVLAIVNLVFIPINIIKILGEGPDLSQPDWAQNLQGTVGIFINIAWLIANVVILLGALKMKQCRSYGLAMAASILCIMFDWNCCCLGIGAGIWAVVMLGKSEVREAFV